MACEREHGFLIRPRRSLVIVVARFVLVVGGPDPERVLFDRALADVEQHLAAFAEVGECSFHNAAPGAPPPVIVDDTMSPEVLHLTQFTAQRCQPSGESVVFRCGHISRSGERPPVERRCKKPGSVVVIGSGDRIAPRGGSGTAKVQRGSDGVGAPVTHSEPLEFVSEAERNVRHRVIVSDCQEGPMPPTHGFATADPTLTRKSRIVTACRLSVRNDSKVFTEGKAGLPEPEPQPRGPLRRRQGGHLVERFVPGVWDVRFD